MGQIDVLRETLRARSREPVMVWRGVETSGSDLLARVADATAELDRVGVAPGDAVVLLGDYGFGTVALLLALIERRAITVPLTPEMARAVGDAPERVSARFVLDCTGDGIAVTEWPSTELPALYRTLHDRQAPGLVLFTSGSSGRPKAVVHDFSRLLDKFRVKRPALATINFLLFDHWGGLNTLFHCLSSGSCIVLPEGRQPHEIARLIAAHRVELLPTTPSFLNLLLLSGAHRRFDLGSLKVISYGAEPMPAATLEAVGRELPGVELRQTYGMIELGVLRARSRSNGSLFLKLGGEQYETRVVDGILQVRTQAAMLGYLDAPSPFTEDGFFITGDAVEEDGEYLRILGRASELINVGGQKVYPSEVEGIILDLPQVQDVVVRAEPNALLGRVVVADVLPADGVETAGLASLVKKHCASNLQSYMVPVRVRLVDGGLTGERLKRRRT